MEMLDTKRYMLEDVIEVYRPDVKSKKRYVKNRRPAYSNNIRLLSEDISLHDNSVKNQTPRNEQRDSTEEEDETRDLNDETKDCPSNIPQRNTSNCGNEAVSVNMTHDEPEIIFIPQKVEHFENIVSSNKSPTSNGKSYNSLNHVESQA